MSWYEFLAGTFAFMLMLVGLVGVVYPFFPGVELVWFSVLLYAAATAFRKVDIVFLALLAVPVLLTYLLDYWSLRWGLRRFHMTGFSIGGAVAGGLIASIFGMVPALTVGPLLGAVIGEMLTGRDSMFAIETSEYKIIGFIGSSLVKIVIGVMIIGAWIAKIRP